MNYSRCSECKCEGGLHADWCSRRRPASTLEIKLTKEERIEGIKAALQTAVRKRAGAGRDFKGRRAWYRRKKGKP